MAVLLTMVLMMCGVLWNAYRGERRAQREKTEKWAAESMLTEAEGVVLDFLDHGREVSQATNGRYRGIISLRMHEMGKTGTMGFCVTMYDCGNLAQIGEDVLSQYHLEGFLKRYGYYYDPERDAIRYFTSQGVKVAPEEKEKLECRLMGRIQNHPLAVIKSDRVIRTRNI